MRRSSYLIVLVLVLSVLSFFLTSCGDDDDDEVNCVSIIGEWDFVIIETWDCDGIAESEPHNANDLHINQLDCNISITGTFRKSMSGIMNGTIDDKELSIDFYDGDVGCTLKIRGTSNDAGDYISGTWEDDCSDSPDDCNGESGTFTATKQT